MLLPMLIDFVSTVNRFCIQGERVSFINSAFKVIRRQGKTEKAAKLKFVEEGILIPRAKNIYLFKFCKVLELN